MSRWTPRRSLNRTARDSYTHAPEPECRSVRHAHENRGGQGRRAHSARYAECANLMHLGLAARHSDFAGFMTPHSSTPHLHRGGLLCAFVLTVVLQAASFMMVCGSEARDLTDVLVQGFPPVIGANDISTGVEAFSPAFAQAVAQAVQQVPVASVAPAFSYRYNPALSIFERSTGVPGPLFSERALTLGKGQLNFSVGYSYVDFSDLNGDDLDNITGPGLFNSPDFSRPLGTLPGLNGTTLTAYPFSAAQLRSSLNVNAHIVAMSLRYGITENWDVGFTVPIVDSFLRVKNEVIPSVDANPQDALFIVTRDQQGNTIFFDANGMPVTGIQPNPRLGTGQQALQQVRFQQSSRNPSTVARAAGSATSIGNITLRTKYRLWQTETGGAALGLNLLLPRSENAQRDFLGTTETHLSTFVYLSEVLWDRVEPHLNMGVDINAEDVNRSSFLYAVGATLLVWKNLGLVVDFLGRSEFEGLNVKVPSSGFYDGVVLN